MKKYKTSLDVLIIVLLLVLSAVTVLPEKLTMPTDLQMLLLVVVFGAVSSFAVLVWRERPADEREAEHQQLASRSAYLAGCSVLILAMLIQGFRHELDSAIPLTLLVMILTKLGIQHIKDKT